jgi:hypothetical protein
MQRCWEIKGCGAATGHERNSRCPVYLAQTDCWRFDWGSFWRNMPAGLDKEEGKNGMIADCLACPVRQKQQADVDRFIAVVRGS